MAAWSWRPASPGGGGVFDGGALLVGFPPFPAADDFAEAGAAVVADDGVEPGLEGGAALELVELVENLEEGVLGDFLGVLGIAEHLEAGVVNEGFIAAEDLPVGGEVVGQFLFGHRHDLGVGEFLQAFDPARRQLSECFDQCSACWMIPFSFRGRRGRRKVTKKRPAKGWAPLRTSFP